MKNLVFIILGIVVLGGLFFLFSKKQQSIPVQNKPVTTTAQPKNVKNFTLVVRNRKLVSGVGTLTVAKNDSVAITITANEDEEFHLHGLDKSVDLEKDKPSTLSFTASISGRFPFELEKSKTELGSLEVQPK